MPGIIKSSNTQSIVDIQLVDWDITYNSQYFLEATLRFNADMQQVENDYINNPNATADAIKIELVDSTDSTFYQLSQDTFSTNSTTQLPADNIITYSYLYSDNSNTPIITDSYKILITLNENLSYELPIDTTVSDANNITTEPLKDVQAITNIISPVDIELYSNNNISADYYFIENTDEISFRIAGTTTKTITFTTLTNIDNYDTLISTTPTLGSGYRSTATFNAPVTNTLSEDVNYTIENNSIEMLFGKDESVINDFNNIACKMDILFDSIDLSESSTTSQSYQINIPIFDDISTKDVTIEMTIFDFDGQQINLNVNEVMTLNNGTGSVTINYPTIS